MTIEHGMDSALGGDRDRGWLRASHRELDSSRSTPLRPWHRHARLQKLRPGDIVPVEIEIWPSATLFEVGFTLQVTIQGQDAARYPCLRSSQTCQPWTAHYSHRRAQRVISGGSAQSIRARRDSSVSASSLMSYTGDLMKNGEIVHPESTLLRKIW